MKLGYCLENLYCRMEKYHGFDQLFYEYLFEKLVRDGGLRMQVIAADLVNELQKKYDAKDPLNIFRKQYGNIYEALKAMTNKPYFDLDNMVIRMKKPEQVRALGIKESLMDLYETQLKANREKEIQIMKINNENECQRCQKTYNVNVNKPGSCGAGDSHLPTH